MPVNDILEIGRQGLQTNRQALQTTSNNIANANTPGYTRRRAVFETNPELNVHGQAMGSGVDIKKVIRIHDDFVEKQIVDERQALGSLRTKSENLRRMEGVVSKNGEHLGGLVTKFFDDYRSLSANPEMAALRTVVGSSADALTEGIRNMNDSFDGMKRELDLRIGDTVQQINTATSQIASLNDSIALCEARGEMPNDLYDKRDLVLRDLAGKIEFQATTDQRGQVNLISGGNTLVIGNERSELSIARTPANEGKGAGQVDIFMRNPGGGERPVTTLLKSGELAGMLHVRDNVLGEAQNHLDKIAFQVSKSVNEVHREGVGLDGVGDRNLFKDVGAEWKGAAFRFGVSDQIKGNHEAIAAGKLAGAPGDNDIALQIADIQNVKSLPATTAGGAENHTINESINALVGRIGVETQKEDSFFHHQQAVVDQLENYQQSIAGVSLEEEAVNLIQYQTVFNASAKAMKVGEELFNTILSLKN